METRTKTARLGCRVGQGGLRLVEAAVALGLVALGVGALYAGTTRVITHSQNARENFRAALILFMAGKKFEVAGKNITANDGDALQFQYYGLPSNKDVRIKKNGDIAAVLYAPNAKIKIEGGGDAVGS